MSRDIEDSEQSDIYGTLAPGWQFYRRKGARLTEEQHDAVATHIGESAPSQEKGWHQFDKAHLVMLAEQGIIPLEAAAKNLKGLRKMEGEGWLEIRQEMGHLGHGGEAYLIRELGEETAGWIHVGRSSGDLEPTAKRFMLRQKIIDMMDAAIDLIAAYCDTAEQYTDAIIPTWTNGVPGSQHAQVGTFGWYLMAVERPIERDIDRLRDAYDRVNVSPAGAACGTTTDFPIDRERTAELLGFDGVLDNSEDATHAGWDTDLEALNIAAMLMADVAKAADHVFQWYMQEFDLVDIADRFLGTSSIMAHKANPHAVIGIQRSPNAPIGDLMSAYAGTRSAVGVHANAQTFDTVVDNIGTWREIVETLTFDRELGRERVYLEWALLTDLSSQMVRKEGINWRWAHQITAILTRQLEEQGKDIREITPEDIDRAAVEYLGEPLGMSEDDVSEILENPERALRDRQDQVGSPAPKQVENQIAKSREFVEESRQTIQSLRDEIDDSERELENAIDAVIQEADLDGWEP